MIYAVPGLYLAGQEWQLPNFNQSMYLLGCGFLGFSAQVSTYAGKLVIDITFWNSY
jgi:hypothetical protein